MTKFNLLLLALLFAVDVLAQNNARITGSLQSNGNVFMEDERITANGPPQYDHQKFGTENWLNLNYSSFGFDFGLRFEHFSNSNLLNPNDAFPGSGENGTGIGRWYIGKKVDKLEISAGYLYDQIGSGLILRAYEERSLFIDNAIIGAKLRYHFNENWNLRAFAGSPKRQLGRYDSHIKGACLEGFFKPDSTKNFTLAPGAGFVMRTFDQATINRFTDEVATYPKTDSINGRYNAYAFTVFNTMTAGDFTWYVEGAAKTEDMINNEFGVRADNVRGKLIYTDGYTVYTSLSYAKKGLGVVLEAKRTKNFRYRIDPFLNGVQGAVNFLPSLARQNTYRLTTRFSPQTLEIDEQAIQLDAKYALSKKFSIGFNFSNIVFPDSGTVYREYYPELTYKHSRKFQVTAGVQRLTYSLPVYQNKAGLVQAVTPFTEVLYKFTPRRSLRVEAQYLDTDEEFGSWAFLLAEVGLAPHWLIYASDMYKVKHPKSSNAKADKTFLDNLHFPTLGIVYTRKANRFSLAYVKQVEGINCAGGVCRYEPTFNGFRGQVNSSF